MAEIFLPKWKRKRIAVHEEPRLLFALRSGHGKITEAMREAQCRKENREMGSAKMDGLGQLKASIPARDYFRWHQFKSGCWGDKSFVKEYLRDNPSFKAQTLTKKSFSGPSFKAA